MIINIEGKFYKAEKEEFKGSPILAIYQVDKSGKKTFDKPVFSFGRMKANLIVNMIDEISAFASGDLHE